MHHPFSFIDKVQDIPFDDVAAAGTLVRFHPESTPVVKPQPIIKPPIGSTQAIGEEGGIGADIY